MFGNLFSLFGRRKRRKVRTKVGSGTSRHVRTDPIGPARLRSAPQDPAINDPRIATLREVFTPTRPQRSFRRLVGRKQELRRILETIAESRGHVVLYGDRGRGKTSLVNLVASSARRSGHAVARYSCSNGSNFDEIIRGLARDLPRALLAAPAVESGKFDGCEAALPVTEIQPRDVAQLHNRLSGGNLLFVIDEFDRVLDSATRTRLADTIKQVSDRGSPLSFLIIGVSDSLEELLGRHPSIQRSVVGVPLPLLSDREVHEVLDIGATDAGLGYPRPICDRIAHVACGSPYVVQLLALRTGERALARGAGAVDGDDFRGAIEQAAAEMDPRVKSLYEQVTHGGMDYGMKELLLATARSPHDGFARFLVRDVDGELRMGGQPIHQARWARLLEGGAVRSSYGAGLGLHTFAEPLLLHYVLLVAELESDTEVPQRVANERMLPVTPAGGVRRILS
jgi:AAA ATPase domain